MGRKWRLNCIARGMIVKTWNPAYTSVTALLPALLPQFCPTAIMTQQNYGGRRHNLILTVAIPLFYIIELI